jgi:ubiquinone/menaquinone biosynthesis C-methylase UbiE
MFERKRFHGKPRDTSWNKVAKWYDGQVSDEGTGFHRDIIIPGVLKMLNLAGAEKVLDLGCGQGVLCRELARLSQSVVGLDLSKKLLKIAQDRSKQFDNIEYVFGDAANLKAFPDASFDIVCSILAIQNMEPLEKIVSETVRVLTRGGRIVWVLNHPCFRIPRQSGWGYDEKRKLQYRRVDRYLSSLKIPIQMHPGAAPDIHTWTFHRPLSTYFGELTSKGFVVNKLEEWASNRVSSPGTKAKAENQAREEIPLFMAISAVKA